MFSPVPLLFFSQTEKFSGAVPQPDSFSPVSMAAEPEPGLEEEHENMKNFLTSSSLSGEQQGLRRSRAVRSKKLSTLTKIQFRQEPPKTQRSLLCILTPLAWRSVHARPVVGGAAHMRR